MKRAVEDFYLRCRESCVMTMCSLFLMLMAMMSGSTGNKLKLGEQNRVVSARGVRVAGVCRWNPCLGPGLYM